MAIELTPVEPDPAMRIAHLAALAGELMAGDPDAASSWLSTPHPLLDQETPLSLAATETGAREVERLIGQSASRRVRLAPPKPSP